MARPIQPIHLSAEQSEKLRQLAQSREKPHSLVRRAQLVLKAADGQTGKRIAQALGLDEDTVGLWRRRWLEGQVELENWAGRPKELGVAIEGLLTDKERPGSPGVFSAEQVCQVVALACETPPAHLSHWTRPELARQAMERGIVETISASSVGRFLKSGGSQATPESLLAKP
jgi:transposase